jgi:hypothetical protein
MKKLLLLATTLFSAQLLSAQITSGSGGQTDEKPVTVKPLKSDEVFDNAFYIKFGIAQPKGAFGGEIRGDADPTIPYQGLDNMGVKNGAAFEMGTIFYLNLPIPEMLKAGIDFTFLDFAINPVDWTTAGGDFEYVEMDPMLFAGAKIGPVFSVNPVDKLIFDVYYKLAPAMVRAPYFSYYNNGDDFTIEMPSKFIFNKAFGINMRFHALTLGWESYWGKLQETGTYTYYNYNTGLDGSETFNSNIGIKTQRLSLGLNF